MSTFAFESQRAFDVWIVEAKTVYRQVPFTVVTDWIQEGRLLDDDQVRISGTEVWRRLADVALLAPYLPRPDPLRAEDPAEALERVELDLTYKRPAGDVDDDVDMIPLIDISMVLLVFFMMSASTLLLGGSVRDTPQAEFAERVERGGALDVGLLEVKDNAGKRLGVNYLVNDKIVHPNSLDQLIKEVSDLHARSKGDTRVILKASEGLSFEEVQQVTVRLEEVGVKSIKPSVRDRPKGANP